MSHDLHRGGPGAIFHDSCVECTNRVSGLPASIGDLDNPTLVRAWSLMVDDKWGGGRRGGARVVSNLDHTLVNQLYAFAVMLERMTGLSAPMVLEMMRAHTGATPGP